jgi:hypothetical protein
MLGGPVRWCAEPGSAGSDTGGPSGRVVSDPQALSHPFARG